MSGTIDVDADRHNEERPLRKATGGDPTRDAGGDLVQWFLDYYWIRHPISARTVEAYRADLHALECWLAVARGKSLVDAGVKDLRAYFAGVGKTGGDAPSVSCIKRFYFYLVECGFRADDPTEQVYVRTPRLVRHDLKLIQGKKI
jgi:site-specific recombinase XerD